MKRLLAMTMAMAMVMTTAIAGFGFTAYGASTSFSDVPSSHWAKSSIDFAAEKQIVKGYYDEYSKIYTFLPEKSVTCEEACVMLWRALNAAGMLGSAMTEEQQTALVEKHKAELDAANIANWAAVNVADLVERGIIETSELGAFVGDANIGNPAPRISVAIWTAKALDAGLAGVYYLPYTDVADITADQRPYVDMLYRQGIMKGSANADGTVSFNARSGVKRCEFAAIANRVYEKKAAAYDAAADFYSYNTAAQLGYLYPAKTFTAVYNGSTAKQVSDNSGLMSKYVSGSGAFVISGATTKITGTSVPTLHIDTAVANGEGLVKSVKKLNLDGKSVSLVGIELTGGSSDGNGTVVYYIANGATKGTAGLTEGNRIRFIADGTTLLEVAATK